MPLLYIIRLSTAPRHETRALWTRFGPKFPGYVPGAGPGVATPLPACVIQFVTAQGFITLQLARTCQGWARHNATTGVQRDRNLWSWDDQKGTPLKTSIFSKRNSSLLCHNCPTHWGHKCLIPIFPLCFTSHICVCPNFSHGEHQCASRCWCSPTWHNYHEAGACCRVCLPRNTHRSEITCWA